MSSKISLIILVLSLLLNFGCAQEKAEQPQFRFKPGSEPLGFRGYEWGADYHQLWPELNYLNFEIDKRDIKYRKKEERLDLGQAQVENIDYYFWKNKFYAVTIYSKGEANFKYLKKGLVEEFGQTHLQQHEQDWVRFYWSGEIANVDLRYIQTNSLSSLRIEEKRTAEIVRREKLKLIEKIK
ncbi:hypothetical protein ACFL1I_00760 [Candidatus Omnitrophota bacterium]